MNWKWPRLTSCLRITLALLLSIMTINPISVSATTFVDLTRDPDDITLRKTEVVEDAVWIRIDNGDPDDDATGTGYFNSFLRLQKSDGERGYNSNLDKVLYDELKSFTDAEMLSVVPYVEYGGRQYREFQLDINENDDYLVLNRLQIWVTEHENLIGSTYPGGVHAFTEDQTVKVYDTGDNVIMLSYRGGSGNREYKVLVPAEDFPDMTYVVIYTEMGFPDDAIPESFGDGFASNDGFEEWGVKVMTELPPVIDVVKTALVTSVPEPGAWVTYKVDIANSSGMTDPVTINSLTDAIEGATAYSISGMIFDDVGLLTPTTFPFTIQPGMTKTVYFKSYVSGEPRTVNDIVTASGVDDEGTPVSDFDDADVVITDVKPIIELIKTADPMSRDEPGGLFTYTFTVKNLSVEPVWLTKVVDDKIGTLYEWAEGMTKIWIAVGGSYLLPGPHYKTYTDAGSYTNIATAYAEDNEGNKVNDTDTKTVTVNDVKPIIELIKTADPLSRDEPGGLFTYTFTVKNLSVEPVWLTKVVDDKIGTLYEWAEGMDKIWIAVGGSYLLPGTYTKTYTDAGSYTNIATAYAEDNEGNKVNDTDTKTVTVNDVKPIIELIKTADPMSRDEPGGLFTYTFTVKNLSVEPVWLTKVVDDKIGTLYEWAEGMDKIWIAVGGSYLLPGTYTKTYTDAGSYTNIATAYAEDNEGNKVNDTDTKTVTVNDVKPIIELIKTADPLSRFEPGGLFAYTYRIYNKSVEPVYLTKVYDDVLGTLYEWTEGMDKIWIPVGESYLLPGVFTETYSNAGTYPNIGEAWAKDNEGNTAYDDDTEMVEVVDVKPIIELIKTADPLSRDEPGGLFTYTFTVKNLSVEPVWLTKVVDDKIGTLYEWAEGMDKIWIAVGGSYLLPGTYTKTYTDAGSYTNIATAYAEDNEGNKVNDTDTKTVTVNDVKPIIELIKTADPMSRDEPGGLFTYTFTVKNLSVEPVWLTKVVDDKIGTLYEWAEGMDKIWIAVGGSYLLPGTYTKTYTDAGSYTNIATAYAEDNEGNKVNDTDTKTVTVNDVKPIIELIKTADPLSRFEPGGLFTYTFTVYNHSVEPVWLTEVVDDKLGTLYEWVTGMPKIWIPVDGSYLLPGTFTKTYTEAGIYPNIAIAYAEDNEGNSVHDDDSRSVTIIDVLPEISITKTANKSVIPFSGEDVIFTFVITNHSVEDVVIYSIDDTIFGDLLPEALVAFGDDPIVIAAGQQFTFTITRFVSGMAGSEHYNVVTACGMDNEQNTDCDDDDELIRLYWYGFTPGYWKNHAEEWYRTDYMPMDKVRLIFGITHTDLIKNGKMDLNKDGQDDTLMDALGYKGGNDLRGKVQILLRAAVAGLLNESALGDYYPPYDDVDELIMAVNAAINTSNKTIINNLAGQIDYWNNGIHEFPD
jgi:hypothetical protein